MCIDLCLQVGINQRDAMRMANNSCTGLLRKSHAAKKQRLLLGNLASMLILSMERWIGASVETSYLVQTNENCQLSMRVCCCRHADTQRFCRLRMD